MHHLVDSLQTPSVLSAPSGEGSLRGHTIKPTQASTEGERTLQQTFQVDLVNNCDFDAYSYIIYRGEDSAYTSDLLFVGQDIGATLNGVADSTFWVYGIRLDDGEKVWTSSDSELCIAPGDCFLRITLDDTTQDNVKQVSMCATEVPAPVVPEYYDAPAAIVPSAPAAPSARLAPTTGAGLLGAAPTAPTSPLTTAPSVSPSPEPSRSPSTSPSTKSSTTPSVLSTTEASSFTPSVTPVGEIEQWLTEHNSRRTAFYAEHGKSPVDLKWSETIAQSAQNYANKLIAQDGCQISHLYDGDTFGGENLAANWGKYAQARSIPRLLNAWYDKQIDLPNLEQKLHATQVVWRSSKYLGCASAEKDMGNDEMCFIQVCRFVAQGNCFFDKADWLRNTLSSTFSTRFCGGVKCEDLPEGCF